MVRSDRPVRLVRRRTSAPRARTWGAGIRALFAAAPATPAQSGSGRLWRVLGGPGTGKSALLVDVAAARIAGGADPESVLLLTHSKQAAAAARDALTERLTHWDVCAPVFDCGPDAHGRADLALFPLDDPQSTTAAGSGSGAPAGADPVSLAGIGRSAHLDTGPGTSVAGATREPLARTIHSYAFGILRRQAARHGNPPPRLLTGAEQDAVLREMLRGDLTDIAAGARDLWPRRLQPALSLDGFADELRDLMLRTTERGLGPEDLVELGRQQDRPDWEAAGRFALRYEQAMLLRWSVGVAAPEASAPALNAAELVGAALDALAGDAELLAAERARLRCLLVDDAQHLDPQAALLVRILAEGAGTTVIAGDPDQAVYTFRGADARSLTDLEVPAARRIVLHTNHRAGPAIHAATARIASRLPGRAAHRTTFTDLGPAERGESDSGDTAPAAQVRVRVLGSPAKEASLIADQLRRAHLTDGVPWSQMAVIVRSVPLLLPPLRRALLAAGVPVRQPATDTPLARRRGAAWMLLSLRAVIAGEAARRGTGSTESLFGPDDALDLLGGPLGGADQIAMRRLRRGIRRTTLELTRSTPAAADAAVEPPEPEDALPAPGTGPSEPGHVLPEPEPEPGHAPAEPEYEPPIPDPESPQAQRPHDFPRPEFFRDADRRADDTVRYAEDADWFGLEGDHAYRDPWDGLPPERPDEDDEFGSPPDVPDAGTASTAASHWAPAGRERDEFGPQPAPADTDDGVEPSREHSGAGEGCGSPPEGPDSDNSSGCLASAYDIQRAPVDESGVSARFGRFGPGHSGALEDDLTGHLGPERRRPAEHPVAGSAETMARRATPGGRDYGGTSESPRGTRRAARSEDGDGNTCTGSTSEDGRPVVGDPGVTGDRGQISDRPSVDILRDLLLGSGDERILAGLTEVELAPLNRALRALGRARRVRHEGGSLEDVLWALWTGSRLEKRWLAQSERGGAAGMQADRDLDAAVALFDAAAAYTDRLPGATLEGFVEYLTQQQIAQDRAARSRQDEAVDLLSAHAAAGREWEVVAVAGVQEGIWPDPRPRGTLLHTEDLVDQIAGITERVSRSAPILAEERRLLFLACSRARRSLLVTAVESVTGERDLVPSRFLAELVGGESDGEPGALPIAEPGRVLALHALVAELRAVVCDPDSGAERRRRAAAQLARLALAGIPGTAPGDWYGVPGLSSTETLWDDDGPIALSPSTVELLRTCPLRWALERHGGSDGENPHAVKGTLVHTLVQALAGRVPLDRVRAELARSWTSIDPGTSWHSRQELRRTEAMLDAFVAWVRSTRAELTQAGVEVPVDCELPGRGEEEPAVRIRGRIDRLERDDRGRFVIVDVKTGKNLVSEADAAQHAQLATYQVAAAAGALDETTADPGPGGARLVYVGLPASSGIAKERVQPAFDAEALDTWRDTIHTAAATTAGPGFLAIRNDGCRHCAVKNSCPVQDAGRQVTDE
ncbi:PD-(D/E)XK nuclease family protein [Nocardia speluncae]|uniref:PD-(D/E)XK nuclease family protein n=1 Tax=Nocardia speluncae TaxID=419477 RepID=UPI001FE0A23D|nr:PD-(D/E)XK nuclease family protein [Nocardia speluncae]